MSPPNDPGRSLNRFAAELQGKGRQGLLSAAAILSNEIVSQLSTPGRGALRPDKVSRASAPGDPPAPDTGTLRGSVDFEATSDDSVRVGVGADYGEHLEFGTVHIAPRPFMRPALEKVRDQMGDAMVVTLRRSGDSALSGA